MDMTGSDGVLSVPAEHLRGLIWLVAAPITVWLVVCGAQALASRGNVTMGRFVRRLGELSIAAQAALFASLVGAGVHAALVSTHWTEDRTRAMLFLVDTLAFLVAIGWTFLLRPGWRLVNLVVLFGTVGAYAVYLLKGWEALDLVGLLTTTIELSVALVLLDPLQPAVGPARTRERWVAAAAIPVALVSLLGTGAVAQATNDGAAHHHHGSDDMADMPGMAGMPGMDHDHGSHEHDAEHGSHVSLATTSPAGWISTTHRVMNWSRLLRPREWMPTVTRRRLRTTCRTT